VGDLRERSTAGFGAETWDIHFFPVPYSRNSAFSDCPRLRDTINRPQLFDVTGNRTSISATITVKGVEFAYDGLSRRVQKKTIKNGTAEMEGYLYDGWN
jgi:hypothetical protein